MTKHTNHIKSKSRLELENELIDLSKQNGKITEFVKIQKIIIGVLAGLLVSGILLISDLVYKNINLNSKIKDTDIELKNKKSELLDLNNTLINNYSIIENLKTDIILKFTKETILTDLAKYDYISEREQKIIYNSVIKYSDLYKINPLILYGILFTESTFKTDIQHAKVNLIIDNKKIQTRAIGLGGVVWEWWSNDLKENNIAQTKSDLFDIDTNINATAYIYTEMFKRAKLKSARTQTESALMRYFGGEYKWYSNRINSKIVQIINDMLLN